MWWPGRRLNQLSGTLPHNIRPGFIVKKVCVVLSMHQILIVLAVLKQKNLGPEYFDCILLREGAHYPEIIYSIFTRANFFIVNKLKRSDIFGRAREIKSLAEAAIRQFDMKDIELWLPNETYHMSNLVFSRANIKKTIAFEDGMGSYIDSGLLEWRSGIRTVMKKMIALMAFFPAYRSLYGVSHIHADEYWALSNKALFSKKINVIPAESYKQGMDHLLTIVPKDFYSNLSLDNGTCLVVIVGQPLSEGGLCSPEESINKFVSMGSKFFSNKLAKKEQMKFIYVSHPAEERSLSAKRLDGFMSASEYTADYCLYENKLSLDILLAYLARRSEGLILVGASSTSLYAAKISGLCNDVYYFADGYGRISSQLKNVFSDFGVVSL